MGKVNSTLDATVFMVEERLCWIFELANVVSISNQFGRLDSVTLSQQKNVNSNVVLNTVFLLVSWGPFCHLIADAASIVGVSIFVPSFHLVVCPRSLYLNAGIEINK